MQLSNEPRGIRNNNPGNIRHGSPWLGLISPQTDPEFCQFITPEYGIRAMIIILYHYQDQYDLHTISSIISRWAPQNQNNTQQYIKFVSSSMNINSIQKINVHVPSTLFNLLRSIILYENGEQPYDSTTFNNAFTLVKKHNKYA